MPNTTATKAKAVNYTADQTAAILKDYAEGMSVDAIAEKTGRTVRSLVAKLSREQVYISPVKAEKATKASMGKADMAAEIAKVGNLTTEAAKDLTKLTKQTLVNLLAAVQKANA